MKLKQIAVLAVVGLTILIAVVITVTPDPAMAPVAEPADVRDVERPQGVSSGAPVEPNAAAVTAAPIPTEEELAAIEARIRNTVYPKPPWERLKRWWEGSGEPRLSKADLDNARALYLRFMDNFARIKTARFRVETFKISQDRSEELARVDEFFWTPEKRRHVVTRVIDGERSEPEISICDGEIANLWRGGQLVESKAAPHGSARSMAEEYLFGYYRAEVIQAEPRFLSMHTTCEIDDGTRGYSRLDDVFRNETRFDTATGMLTQANSRTYTYQNVGGVWFLREILFIHEGGGERKVFSDVVLNEPIGEALLNADRP